MVTHRNGGRVGDNSVMSVCLGCNYRFCDIFGSVVTGRSFITVNIHEYQAKELGRKVGLPVPEGDVATTPDEAKAIAEKLGGEGFVVKAQVHAGGRGKAGGVKIAKTTEKVKQYAAEIIGMTLVSPQTGPKGKLVRKVLVERAGSIERELYVGFVLNRSINRYVLTYSEMGGVDTEEVARKHPEKILQEQIDPAFGLEPYQARKAAVNLGLEGDLLKQGASAILALWKVFDSTDASLAECNPLTVTSDGKVEAVDCKIVFDDNALYRHKDLKQLMDADEEDPRELKATEAGLSYVSLDGNIGCLVNGAGLAMATMDLVANYGGMPANFLDIGGGADKERVEEALRIILADESVKAIFINIFGGIVRCTMVAEGVVEAAREIGIDVPLVVSLKGTQQEEGRAILASSDLDIHSAETMSEAAQKAVDLAQ